MMVTNRDAVELLRTSKLAFAGRVTASVTHELNNVLSTVGELSGLLEDVAASDPTPGAVSQERLGRIATGLMVQVKRGAEIVKRLNRFAHSSDEDIQSVDLRDLVALMAGLAGPLIHRHSVTLETDFGDSAIMIQTNAFLLEQLLYLWIDEAASASERAETVRIACHPHSQGGVVEIIWNPEHAGEQSTDQIALLDVLARELRGEVEEASADDGIHRRAMTLPQALT